MNWKRIMVIVIGLIVVKVIWIILWHLHGEDMYNIRDTNIVDWLTLISTSALTFLIINQDKRNAEREHNRFYLQERRELYEKVRKLQSIHKELGDNTDEYMATLDFAFEYLTIQNYSKERKRLGSYGKFAIHYAINNELLNLHKVDDYFGFEIFCSLNQWKELLTPLIDLISKKNKLELIYENDIALGEVEKAEKIQNQISNELEGQAKLAIEEYNNTVSSKMNISFERITEEMYKKIDINRA